ncbi:MAG: phosphotransferase [Bacillota bacterium]|nr:phosphotransferase [Bacillota bacterium]
MVDGQVQRRGLLHLDYHPMNVLTNGKSITAVIDWANACINDPVFDVARTFSMLRVEANRLQKDFGLTDQSVEEFERGWMEGYREKGGVEGQLSSDLKAWAGFRMHRDLLGKRSGEELRIIEGWAKSWLMEEEA